jgi:hypothetical protein
MLPEQVELLKRRYTGRYVMVDAQRPELARLGGKLGCVKTVNFDGRALVQFEGIDPGWHDIDPEFLKVVEKPQAAAVELPPEKAETKQTQ